VRIVIRTSKWAIWARRLGSLALPLVILPVIMHRERLLDSAAFTVVIVFAGIVAALAILASLIALVRLWYTGDQGWSRALSGLVLGALCLAPFGWYGMLALRYPPVTDIATTNRAELPLVFEPDTATIPPPRVLSPTEQQQVFPNVSTRTYPLDVVQLFALVDRLVRAEGWDVRQRREPIEFNEIGSINARIVTIPGWREEAVFRVQPLAEGASVDMRSASIGAVLDFGSNGTRIEDFLVALDNEVTAFLRDNPNVTQAPVTEDEAPSVETGAGN
jgi:hypothetical protein